MAAKKKILIVDDEIGFLTAMERSILKKADFVNVLTASSGHEALDKLSREEIDLILADFRMPEITGLDLLYRIRSQWPNVEIILMSGYCTDELRDIAQKNGCRYIFEKPFSMSEIRNTILSILKEKEKGFAGIIKSVSLTDLIQMCCLDGASKSIRIRRGPEEAFIHVANGEIVDASCGELQGMEAFYKIIRWPMGSFETLELLPTIEKRIFNDWQYLLMEGSRKLDEEDMDDADEEDGEAKKAIRLMIVDDSAIMIRALTDIFSSSNRIAVAGSASNGEQALTMLDEVKPDVMTLDVNMPVMDGGTALKHIMIKSRCPVVIVSSITTSRSRDQIMEFLKLGAVDFLNKPKNNELAGQKKQFIDIICRAAGACTANFKRSREGKEKTEPRAPVPDSFRCDNVVAINSGPGGHAEAIKLICALPVKETTGFILLQAIPDTMVEAFAEHINRRSRMEVSPLYHGAPLLPGKCYLGAIHRQWVVDGGEPGEFLIKDLSGAGLKAEDPFCQFLESVVDPAGLRLMAVLLSGAVVTDIESLEELVEAGSRVVAPNKDSLVVSDFLTPGLAPLVEQMDADRIIRAISEFG